MPVSVYTQTELSVALAALASRIAVLEALVPPGTVIIPPAPPTGRLGSAHKPRG